MQSTNSDIVEFDCGSLIKNIIQLLREEIKDVFVGKQVKTKDANDSQVSFFEANLSKQPAGKLVSIQGKNSQSPKYISIESLTEPIENSGSDEDEYEFDEYEMKQRRTSSVGSPRKTIKYNIRNLQPAEHLPEKVHPIVNKLIGKKEDQLIFDASKNSLAMLLAQSLKSIENQKLSVWE